jgi:hypothetical protein
MEVKQRVTHYDERYIDTNFQSSSPHVCYFLFSVNVCGRWFLPAMSCYSWPCNHPQVTAQPFNLYINNSIWTSRGYVSAAFTHHFSVHTCTIINLLESVSLPYGWVKVVLIGPHIVQVNGWAGQNVSLGEVLSGGRSLCGTEWLLPSE